MTSVTDIELAVLSELKTLLPRGTNVSLEMRLIEDLKLLSDDATALALDMERKFKVQIPRLEWATVLTVQDTINLLAAHVGRGMG
jgi:acyl carrier protein